MVSRKFHVKPKTTDQDISITSTQTDRRIPWNWMLIWLWHPTTYPTSAVHMPAGMVIVNGTKILSPNNQNIISMQMNSITIICISDIHIITSISYPNSKYIIHHIINDKYYVHTMTSLKSNSTVKSHKSTTIKETICTNKATVIDSLFLE